MTTEHLDLTEHAPAAAECGACRDRYIERLKGVGGVHSVRPGADPATLHVEVDGSNSAWRLQAGEIGASLADGLEHARLAVGDLDCAECVESLAAAARALPGVHHAAASFAARRLDVGFDPRLVRLGQIARAVRRAGFTVEFREGAGGRALARYRLGTTGLLYAAGLALSLLGLRWAWVPLAVVVVVEARPIFIGAAASLRRRAVTMDVLMGVAILGACALGQWLEAGAVAWLAAFGAGIQDWAGRRTRSALDGLLSLAPLVARVVREGEATEVPAEQVAAGDVVEVYAGERIPVDGEVVEGFSDANEAPLTGEGLPVPKSPGCAVFAGSVSLSGTLRVRATRSAANTALARMIRLIEQAEERRAPIQATIDRFAHVYTPIVVLLALGAAVVPPLAFGLPWQPWLHRGLWLLVVACPCALVIATPVAVVSAIGAASRMGALIKGGDPLEALARARVVVFDKTGTLTRAELTVSRIVPQAGVLAEELLSVAAAAERQSKHPAATAITREAAARGGQRLTAENVRTVPGMGIEAHVAGVPARVGRPEWMRAMPEPRPGEAAVAAERDGKLLGLIYLCDAVRPDARAAVQELRQAGLLRQLLLSGDSQQATEALAADLGIAESAGGLLPEDKERRVRELEAEGGRVLMIGDGINDLAAMHAATVAMAMGATGTDAAAEHAGVVLMHDHLRGVAPIIRLSRRAIAVMRENITVSLAVKLGLVLAAIPAPLPLWLAVVGDVGLSVLVTLNAARLLLAKPTQPAS